MKVRHRKKRVPTYDRNKLSSFFACHRCGETTLGGHFVGPSVLFPHGFWTCRDMYDENGRRKEADKTPISDIGKLLQSIHETFEAINHVHPNP